jgi:hypothetical protein
MERGTISNLVVDIQTLEGGNIGRRPTSCGRTNTIIGVRNLVDLKVEKSLPQSTFEKIFGGTIRC